MDRSSNLGDVTSSIIHVYGSGYDPAYGGESMLVSSRVTPAFSGLNTTKTYVHAIVSNLCQYIGCPIKKVIFHQASIMTFYINMKKEELRLRAKREQRVQIIHNFFSNEVILST